MQNAVDFGIVHVGETVAARNVSVKNDAATVALNDTVTGNIGGAAGPFGTSGNLGTGVQAQQTDSTSLNVSLDTSAPGVFSGNATVDLFSHNPDMADLELDSVLVALDAQVNNYANADLNKTGGAGAFSAGGLVYTLDFGNVLLGSDPLMATLEVLNEVAGPADLLDGDFVFQDPQDFAYSLFDAFYDLGAGDAQGGMTVSLNPIDLGVFSDDILLSSSGHNASGYRGALDGIMLRIRADVVSGGAVPEPGTLALLGIALAGLLLVASRRAHPG